MNPSEFLTSRLDEWEALARAATPGSWVAVAGALGDPYNGPDHMRVTVSPYLNASEAVVRTEYDARGGADTAHIAANDPAFVLAQVAALRAVVKLHRHCRDDLVEIAAYVWECRTLLALAQPWAEHPDFRPEWVT